jgi:hypothetical protein
MPRDREASHFRVANTLSHGGKSYAHRDRPELPIVGGVMSQARATREAPAQAELRPTCAGDFPDGDGKSYAHRDRLELPIVGG